MTDSSSAATIGPPAPTPAATPFSREELNHALLLPLRLMEVVLAERGRLIANITGKKDLGRLALAMIVGSVLFALPYGTVLEPSRFFDIATLFVGSMAICFPSLLVFSAYLGVSITLPQNLVLALIITTASALFCFGFFPILWFLRSTMAGDDQLITAGDISIGLLTVSLIAGISQLNRCLFVDKALRGLRSNPLLLLFWQGLLIFITYRMANVLEIL
jgi:hypothetical protein